LADKSQQLILEALGRALAEPAGLPLLGGKKAPGLFTSTASNRALAQRCRDEGLLRPVENGHSSKAEIWAITEKGLAFLLDQQSPRTVLEDLVGLLKERETQVLELSNTVRSWQSGLEGLRTTIERVLAELLKPGKAAGPEPSANGSSIWLADMLTYLQEWRGHGHSSDCPLPDLYRRAQAMDSGLTIGHFHDGVRRLNEQGRIYLHPWTGPLYDIPEPLIALLVGHEIAYYASIRDSRNG
jgi:hypothetical protein